MNEDPTKRKCRVCGEYLVSAIDQWDNIHPVDYIDGIEEHKDWQKCLFYVIRRLEHLEGFLCERAPE